MLALSMNRSRKSLFTEELEDGELKEVDIVGKFDDGYDENLMGDDADRSRLAGLSELDRERELYERSVRREDQMFKWGIRNMLMEKKKSQLESVDKVAVAVKERATSRQLHLVAQRVTNKKRSALDQLVAQRRNKRGKYDLGIITHHITADEDEEELLLQQQQQQRGQVHGIESKGREFTVKKLKLKTQDIYSDDSSNSSDDDYMEHQETLVESLADLQKAILIRNQLEDFLEKPIFDKTVIGCFVRVSVGAAPYEQRSTYRLAEIIALETIDYEYQLGSRRTKRVLQLKLGAYQQKFLMNVVSNQAVTISEFLFFAEAYQRDSLPLPSLSRVSEKEKDIEKATNYAFTEDDVELLVQKKRQAGLKLVSPAYRKIWLITERDQANESKDVAKANELDREIKLIDEQLNSAPQQKRVKFIKPKIAPRIVKAPPVLNKPKSETKKIDWQQYMRKRYRTMVGLPKQKIQSDPISAEPELGPIIEPTLLEPLQEPLQAPSLLLQESLKPLQAPSVLPQAPLEPIQAPSELMELLQVPLVLMQAPLEPLRAPSALLQAPLEPLQAPSVLMEPLHSPSLLLQAPLEPLNAPSVQIQAPLKPNEAPSELMPAPLEPLEPHQSPPQPLKPLQTPSVLMQTPLEPLHSPSVLIKAPLEPIQAPSVLMQAPLEPLKLFQAPSVLIQAPLKPLQAPSELMQAPLEPFEPHQSPPEPLEPIQASSLLKAPLLKSIQKPPLEPLPEQLPELISHLIPEPMAKSTMEEIMDTMQEQKPGPKQEPIPDPISEPMPKVKLEMMQCVKPELKPQPESKPEPDSDQVQRELEVELDSEELNLYDLFNFRVSLDVSKLLKFNEIFSEPDSRYLL